MIDYEETNSLTRLSRVNCCCVLGQFTVDDRCSRVEQFTVMVFALSTLKGNERENDLL